MNIAARKSHSRHDARWRRNQATVGRTHSDAEYAWRDDALLACLGRNPAAGGAAAARRRGGGK